MPRETPEDKRVLLKQLPFPFRSDKVAPGAYRPVPGVKLIGAPVGSDRFVASFLRSRIQRVDELICCVEELHDPRIATNMHRLCASVVQVVHIFA